MVEAFRRGGAGKPMALQAAVGYAPDEGEAWRDAHARWPVAGVGQDLLQNLPMPDRIAREANAVRVEDLHGKLRVSADLSRHAEWIRADFEARFETVYLHFVGRQPDRCIDAFAGRVLPRC